MNLITGIFERSRVDLESLIFEEICKTLTTIASNSVQAKKYFAVTLNSRKESPTHLVIETLKTLSHVSKSNEVALIFELLSSLVL